MKNSSNAASVVIYVGRTEGENSPWVKVGSVKTEGRLGERAREYKVADRNFWFVTRAAWEVELPVGVKPRDFETLVQADLRDRGLKRRGELFLPRDGSIELLCREVEDVIRARGVRFVGLDVSELRAKQEAANAKVQAELDGLVAAEACPYRAFLAQYEEVPFGRLDQIRRSSLDRELMAMGHILRDVLAGSGISELRLVFGHDRLVVYPQTLPAALFQAGAEADLALPATLSFAARPRRHADLSGEVAMVLERGDPVEFHIDRYAISGPFLASESSLEHLPDQVRFSPEHLACLGRIGMEGAPCYYHGLETRAPMPQDLMPVVEKNLSLLPGIRFWLGLHHAQEAGIHLLGYRLPAELGWLQQGLGEAAEALAAIGRPIAPALRTWVRTRLFEGSAAAESECRYA